MVWQIVEWTAIPSLKVGDEPVGNVPENRVGGERDESSVDADGSFCRSSPMAARRAGPESTNLLKHL